MKTISLQMRGGISGASVSFTDVLELLQHDVAGSNWSIRDVEVVGRSADALYAIEGRDDIPMSELKRIAEGLDQVIDGEFWVLSSGSASPWLVVRGVDGTAWDIATDRDAILNKFRQRYPVYEAGDQPY